MPLASDLGPAANSFVNELAKAVGLHSLPSRMVKEAKARLEVEKIEIAGAFEKLDLINNELGKRLFHRFGIQEITHQLNFEAIAQMAIPLLSDKAKPKSVSHDWYNFFFDSSKGTSVKDLQEIWAKILAGEVNKPGSFSRRTLALVTTLDQKDAEFFERVSNCHIVGPTGPNAIIFYNELNHPVYKDVLVNSELLMHLEAIGLISFQSLGFSWTWEENDPPLSCRYFDDTMTVLDNNRSFVSRSIQTGNVVFTEIGKELIKITKPKYRPEFALYLKNKLGISIEIS